MTHETGRRPLFILVVEVCTMQVHVPRGLLGGGVTAARVSRDMRESDSRSSSSGRLLQTPSSCASACPITRKGPELAL
jgi:hypothetical protein